MIHTGQSYRKQPPEGDYDAIIIGSGVIGLATAALLAKHGGKRVLVLERHYMEISTPLSTRHFSAYEHGEIYGLDHSPARFLNRSLRPRTAIPGLYLTGQDVVSCGVAGAMAGGYLTGSVILGKNLLKAAG